MGSARKAEKAALEFPKSPHYALAALHRQLEDPQLHYLRRYFPVALSLRQGHESQPRKCSTQWLDESSLPHKGSADRGPSPPVDVTR